MKRLALVFFLFASPAFAHGWHGGGWHGGGHIHGYGGWHGYTRPFLRPFYGYRYYGYGYRPYFYNPYACWGCGYSAGQTYNPYARPYYGYNPYGNAVVVTPPVPQEPPEGYVDQGQGSYENDGERKRAEFNAAIAKMHHLLDFIQSMANQHRPPPPGY